MFEQAFKNIDDVLRKEAGCTTELDYTEQTSWLLFLKYLDALEQDKVLEAALKEKKHTFILDKRFRWEMWAAPKGKNGKINHNKAMVGDDLRDFVSQKLFPCTASSRRPAGRTPSNTRSARYSERSRTRFRAATTSARLSSTSTNCTSARRPRSTS